MALNDNIFVYQGANFALKIYKLNKKLPIREIKFCKMPIWRIYKINKESIICSCNDTLIYVLNWKTGHILRIIT